MSCEYLVWRGPYIMMYIISDDITIFNVISLLTISSNRNVMGWKTSEKYIAEMEVLYF